MTKIIYGMFAYVFAAAVLTGCATVGTGIAAQLGPAATALLGPEVGQVLALLQGRGAMAVETAFGTKFRATTATDEASARAALERAQSRKRLLDTLRRGNDYSQFVQGMDPAARARLDEARAATDAAYLELLARLAEHVPAEVASAAAAAI